jgi:putative ABC transport system permease protein
MKQHQPPKFARRIFEWYCGQAKVNDLLGDVEELFYLNLKTKSVLASKWIYWKQVFSLLISYAVKKRKTHAKVSGFAASGFSMAILNNYFKIATRNLYKHKYFTIVNAVGLAIGMSVSLLLITLYVHVTTFENFHAHKENIFRVTTTHRTVDREWEVAPAPFSVAENLNSEFVGVDKTVRINSSFSGEVVSGNLNIPLNGYYTESSFFEVFNFPLIQGNPLTALSKPNSILLTESAARKVFNTTDVLGKTFEIKDRGNFEVTGVLAEPRKNTHMVFEALVSHTTLPAAEQTYSGDFKDWRDYGRQYVYVRLKDKSVIPNLEKYLSKLGGEASKRADAKIDFHLQALTDINPGKDLYAGLGQQWDITGLIIFGVICLLILLPACFNYANISIARALKRSKEIGLRKTMGGLKNQIFFQFITETVVITFISLLGALIIFYFIRAEFQSMMVSGSMLDLSLTWQITLAFILFAVVTGFLAGFFPAMHFAGLNPIQAMKSQGGKHSSKNRIRKGLTIFQFSLSLCFIIALVLFSRQYQYTINFDFGFQRQGIVDVQLQDVKPEQFRNEFTKLASVRQMSMSSHILGVSMVSGQVRSIDTNDSLDAAQIFIDSNYLDIFKLKLLAGKNFPNDIWQREKYIIVNEEFVKDFHLGAPTDAIGKLFQLEGNDVEVIGVIQNFNYSRLSQKIGRFLFRMNPKKFTIANLTVNSTDAHEPLEQMESSWRTLEPEKKFEARFFDDELRESYDFYENLLKLVGFLGLLALSISLLGLLGMVVYTSETKVKEVGVRKVMGASTASIIVLLSKDYLKLMLWATVFAIPVSIFVADGFLAAMQHYHVTLSFWDILLSLSILMTLGVITISSQTFKTASTNPAETLRTE